MLLTANFLFSTDDEKRTRWSSTRVSLDGLAIYIVAGDEGLHVRDYSKSDPGAGLPNPQVVGRSAVTS